MFIFQRPASHLLLFCLSDCDKSFEAAEAVAASLLKKTQNVERLWARNGEAQHEFGQSARFISSQLDFISSFKELRVAPKALALARSFTPGAMTHVE